MSKCNKRRHKATNRWFWTDTALSNCCTRVTIFCIQIKKSVLPVAAANALPLLDVRKLRLADAHALLAHGNAQTLLGPEDSPLVYIQSLIDSLCELSLRDPLTGLANRRHLRAVLEREIDVVARSGESALLLMLDIDHFKKINDAHGHPAGDAVLQAVARCLNACVRPKDTVARYGGEEFAVVLPDCQVSFGNVVAERIRQMIEALYIPVTPVQSVHVTVSIGGAYAPEWIRSTAVLWTDRADTELYRAKTQGRNRVSLADQRGGSVSSEEREMLFGQFGHHALSESGWIDNLNDEIPPMAPDPAMDNVNRPTN